MREESLLIKKHMDLTTVQTLQTTVGSLDLSQTSPEVLTQIGIIFKNITNQYVVDQFENADPATIASVVAAFTTANQNKARIAQVTP